MPKAKDKRPRVPSDDGSDDSDGGVGPTQASVARSQRADQTLSQLPPAEQEDVVNNVVRYLLIADQKKLPIKRADIVKHAMKDHGRAFGAVMKVASEKLRTVFGIDAVYEEKVKGYILINTLDNMFDDPHQYWPPEDHATLGLVMVILTVIFMKGNKIDDEVLFDALRRLGVDVDNNDETFGDVRRLVTTTFVKQGYLEMEREPGDPPRSFFSWGPRARLETTKTHALSFVGQVFNQSTERWTAQMRDIELSESSANNE